MDEDFLDVSESGSKKIAIVLVLIVIAILVFGYFFVYQKHHFNAKNLTVEVGSELSEDIRDYINNKNFETSGLKLDLNRVNTGEVGEYTYTITYNKRIVTGKIKVVDTTAPVFTVKDEIKVEANDEDFYLGSILTACEDASKPCLVSLKNDKDHDKLNVIGTHTLDIVVADLYGNKANGTVTITVLEKGTLVKDEELDLTIVSYSDEIKDFKDEFYLKFDKAYDPESEELEDIKSQISVTQIDEYVNSKYSGYKVSGSKIVEALNKSGYVVGLIVEVTIDNGSARTIYMTK